MIAELWRPKRPPSGAPYSYRKEKETWVDFLMVIMASGIARGCVCTTATAMPTTTSESRNMVAILQIIGGQRHAALVNHEFLPCTSLIFEISVMITCHLSKQGICWPVSCDHIMGSSVQLIKVTCFLKLTADQVLVFDWITGSSQVNSMKTGQHCLETG